MESLSGKIAIVTGGGTGVGKGIALALAKEGVDIAVVGRTESKVKSVARQIEDIGRRALSITCDVCEIDEISAAVSQTAAAFGRIDILVNNAQTPSLGRILDMSVEGFEVAFRSGTFATFHFMRACYPYLKKHRGIIVNLGTSLAQHASTAGCGIYAATKQAIRALTHAAACEWGKDGIRVNTIMPLAMSEAMEGWFKDNPTYESALVASVPLGYIGDCEADIGRAVVFLCGSDSRYITGATIPLDGGMANFG
jgi:meso-butanediol dehydrogenase / (S,S)-butanediol dehydrogenase / diacetyl reductase